MGRAWVSQGKSRKPVSPRRRRYVAPPVRTGCARGKAGPRKREVFSPEILAQVFIFGLANGTVIALIALGYTLVYGIVELINFAHGDVFMIGAMLALTLVGALGLTTGAPGTMLALELLGILLACMVFCAVLNVAIERFAYRPLRKAPRLAPFISAIGVSFMLVNVGLFWKGPSPRLFPHLLPSVDLVQATLGTPVSVAFTTKDLFVILLTAPLMVALHLFVGRTRLGKAMRATAQDREAAAMMGIDVNRTIALAFLLGGALAGAGGFIAGLYNNQVHFFMGFRAGLMSFTAAVLGGIGNIIGAVLGGLLIGIISSYSDFYLDPRWTQVVVFGILIVLMIFRPAGLLGESTPDRA
ncbi:MAG: branched-chain amino acid ABC transporter permease [Chloroflexi bacterium]|nr:branched-chain amino acid ABC transporter permease [Chloroflexota bacterium]